MLLLVPQRVCRCALSCARACRHDSHDARLLAWCASTSRSEAQPRSPHLRPAVSGGTRVADAAASSSTATRTLTTNDARAPPLAPTTNMHDQDACSGASSSISAIDARSTHVRSWFMRAVRRGGHARAAVSPSLQQHEVEARTGLPRAAHACVRCVRCACGLICMRACSTPLLVSVL